MEQGFRLCQLCFEYHSDSIDIHRINGEPMMRIADVLAKHFAFGQFEEDGSKYICVNCWETVETFDAFYIRIESAYKQYCSRQTDEVNKCDGNATLTEFPESIDGVDVLCGKIAHPIADKVFHNPMNKENDTPDEISTASDRSESLATTLPRPRRRGPRNYLTLTVRPTQITNEDYQQIHKYFDMTCDHCPHRFSTLEEARMHYRKEHTVNGYLKCCNQKFKYPKDIFNHVEWHTNPSVNQCEFCQKFFKTAKAKAHHILLHSQEKNFSCGLCLKQFARKFLLDNHMKYYCTETKHERIVKRTNGKAPHDKLGKQKRVMTTTVISTIDEGLTKLVEKSKPKRPPQTFVCDLCGRCYTAKTSLDYHQANHHQNADKVQCPICSAWYVSKYIKRHISQHNDTAVMCDICQKEFKNNKNLKAHMKNAHLVSEAERRLACNICEKRFLYPFHLKQHMISHTGGSLYKCTNCSKEFKRGQLYRQHRKICCIPVDSIAKIHTIIMPASIEPVQAASQS